MLNILGCVLVIGGCTGFAASICKDATKRLKLLKQIRGLYENMKYYIAYQKATIPEALWWLSKKSGEPFGDAFALIYERVYGQGEDFPLSWEQCIGTALQGQPLTKEEMDLVLLFPSRLGFMEEGAQALALDELLREIGIHIEELEKGLKGKNKMVMSLGVGVGVLLSILLL